MDGHPISETSTERLEELLRVFESTGFVPYDEPFIDVKSLIAEELERRTAATAGPTAGDAFYPYNVTGPSEWTGPAEYMGQSKVGVAIPMDGPTSVEENMRKTMDAHLKKRGLSWEK